MSEFGSITLRRIILVATSLVVGIIGCYISVWYILGTTMSDYGPVYIFFTIGSIACGVAIWLDHEKVLNTQILPH
jgi:NO-binding membrane sensor protein with MHYT domain